MAKKRKLTGGEGWSLESDADTGEGGRPGGMTSPVGGGRVRVRLEKRARGKVVSVVEGLALDAEGLRALLGELKKKCGGGGTLRADGFEMQGDHLVTIRSHLTASGHPPTA